MADFDHVKDSGARRDFDTGSVRDVRTGKGRYDLLPPVAIKRLAQHFENGAVKYGDKNWELGQPLSGFLDSGLRHGFNLLDLQVDEDHAAAAVWNFVAFLCTAEWIIDGRLPRSLDDIGFCDALEEAREDAELEGGRPYVPPVLAEAEMVVDTDLRENEGEERTTVLSREGSPEADGIVDFSPVYWAIPLTDHQESLHLGEGWQHVGYLREIEARFEAGPPAETTDRLGSLAAVQRSLDRDQRSRDPRAEAYEDLHGVDPYA